MVSICLKKFRVIVKIGKRDRVQAEWGPQEILWSEDELGVRVFVLSSQSAPILPGLTPDREKEEIDLAPGARGHLRETSFELLLVLALELAPHRVVVLASSKAVGCFQRETRVASRDPLLGSGGFDRESMDGAAQFLSHHLPRR